MSFLKRLLADDSGQDLAEYGIALAVIAVAAGGVAVAISTDVGQLWSNAQTAIHSAL
jgi:Flp pilus assembly pilin Flp